MSAEHSNAKLSAMGEKARLNKEGV